MAIPSTPTNPYIQTANGQVFSSCDPSAGATSYVFQRSLDNVTFATIATVSVPKYLDTAVTLGTAYWYQIAASNGSGTSPYTQAQSVVPTTSGELSLGEIRQRAQQRADRVNSKFVTVPEWNFFINQAMFELYDLLVTLYEDLYVAPAAQFSADGSTFLYPLPDGVMSFINQANQSFVPRPFYKLIGVDLSLNSANNAYVTVNKFNFIDRNRFVYPNTASTIYGVFNLQYRLLGKDKIEFIPTPSAGQILRLWYVPRLTELLQDTDVSDIGISGWLQYVIIRAAKYALDKEESDTSKLDEELMFLKKRIEESASNRDAGQPDTVSAVRNDWGWGHGFGPQGGIGGWLVALAPILSKNNIGNDLLANSILSSQFNLTNLFIGIAVSYISYLTYRKFGSWIKFSRIRNFLASSSSTFFSHIKHVIELSSLKQMTRSNTTRLITPVTNKIIRLNVSITEFIRNSMSRFSNAFKIKSSVTTSILVSNPKPTPSTFSNSTPKFSFIRGHNAYIQYNADEVKS